MAGTDKGCSDYPGYTEITTKDECETAAIYLGDWCTTVADISSNIYPPNCFFNKAASSCGSFISRIYFNSESSVYDYGSTTRFPVCKFSGSPTEICSVKLGDTATGGTTTPSLDASIFTCPSAFNFVPYNRTGYLYFGYFPLEKNYDWGFQQWIFDIFDPTTYNTLYTYSSGDSFYDQVQGVAIDNSRNLGYTMIKHKWGSSGNNWQTILVQIDLDTGTGSEILTDYWPYNCHHLSVTTFRAIMDIDEVNNILYWMGTNSDDYMTLYSLDFNGDPLQVVNEVIITTQNDQLSQLVVDCNGNVWFTNVFYGLYLYKPGWNDALVVISEAGLHGFQWIQNSGLDTMDLVIANYFVVRQYTTDSILSDQSYTTYPSPPHQQRTGSDGDRMHNLIWDYQNTNMCSYTATNDGDNMLLCYDPSGDTNIVWNYIKGPFDRQQIGIRYGNYRGLNKYTAPNTNTSICDVMDSDSLKYTWIGGSLSTSTTGCVSQPCMTINDQQVMQRRINTLGMINLAIRFDYYITGFETGEGMYFEYDCNGTGFIEATSYVYPTHLNGGGTEIYTWDDPDCENNRDIIIQFRVDGSFSSEAGYIDNFCVHGEDSAVPFDGIEPPSLPWCDDLTNYYLSGYWTDYADTTAFGEITIATSSYCIGTSTCVDLYQTAELNLIDFDTTGKEDLYIQFNLCLGCDTSAKMSSSEYFYVKYSCDSTYNFNTLQTYSGDLISSYGDNPFPDQIISLPAECDNNENVRLQFQLYAPFNHVYLDSFCVKQVTPVPTDSPSHEPTYIPTNVPTATTDAPTYIPTNETNGSDRQQTACSILMTFVWCFLFCR